MTSDAELRASSLCGQENARAQWRSKRPHRTEATMPTYLVTYHHGPGLPSDPAVLQQMLAAFQTWVAGVGPAMIDPGAPLGAAKTVSADGVVDGQQEATIGGYTLLEAGSLDEAVALL